MAGCPAGVGGAAVIAGVVVAVMGFREAKTARRVSVIPALSPMGAAATIRVATIRLVNLASKESDSR